MMTAGWTADDDDDAQHYAVLNNTRCNFKVHRLVE